MYAAHTSQPATLMAESRHTHGGVMSHTWMGRRERRRWRWWNKQVISRIMSHIYEPVVSDTHLSLSPTHKLTQLIEFGYNGGLIVTRKTQSCHTYMNQSYLTHTYFPLPHTNQPSKHTPPHLKMSNSVRFCLILARNRFWSDFIAPKNHGNFRITVNREHTI